MRKTLVNQVVGLAAEAARAMAADERLEVLVRDRFITLYGHLTIDGNRFYVNGKGGEAAFDPSDIYYIEGKEINLKC